MKLIRTLEISIPFLLANVLLFWMSVLPMELIEFEFLGIIIMLFAVGITLMPIILPRPRWQPRKTAITCTLAALFGGSCLSIMLTNWPLIMAYRLSEADMELVVREFKAGHPGKYPRKVGWFYIYGVSTYGPIIWLITDTSSGTEASYIPCAPNSIPKNEWSHINLSETWQF